MAVEKHIYDEKFFQNTIKLETESASQFVDIILKYYTPASVIDIGCGAGMYLQKFQQRGLSELLGIDGSPAAATEFLLDQDKLVIFDLTKKYKLEKKYDLALCLEVAEHLPETGADTLIETIISASDNVIFTAAVCGQGPRSIGHINEQPHQYWIEKFQARGFRYLESKTEAMRAEMKDQNVVWWLVNNLMIFERS